MTTDKFQETFEDLIQNEILKCEKFRGLLWLKEVDCKRF